MNNAQFEEHLQTLQPPSIEPGPHGDDLKARLLADVSSGATRSASQGHRRKLVLIIGLIGASAVAAGTIGTYAYVQHRIHRGVHWSRSESFSGFEDVASSYRDELKELWERGKCELAQEPQVSGPGLTTYMVRFTLHDGTTLLVGCGDPPDPAKRREWRALRDAGRGTAVGTWRLPDSGMLLYINRYVLSDGDAHQTSEQFPPLAPEELAAAQEFISAQIKAGEGVVVGSSQGMPVVEFKLPGGRPFTTVQPNPPAALTPAREAEIHAQQSRGEGKFIVQSLTAGGAAYIVEYQLADGTVFRVGDDRPVMSDAEWERTRAEAQRLYAAGQYERNTVTGLDGTSVPVIEMTLSSGYHAVIPDNPTVIHFTWGLVEITPQRAAEIEALRSRGAGTLVEQLFAPDETTYLVDYQLADGTVVRAKDDRPVMSAAEWESTRAEARRLYQAGQYERKVITPDDEPVRVIEITLSTGETVVILDHPKVTQDIWGLD